MNQGRKYLLEVLLSLPPMPNLAWPNFAQLNLAIKATGVQLFANIRTFAKLSYSPAVSSDPRVAFSLGTPSLDLKAPDVKVLGNRSTADTWRRRHCLNEHTCARDNIA